MDGMRPNPTVGGLAAAAIALVVAGALALAFVALARERDEAPPPRVVTIEPRG
jgi:hypothetical protein